MAKLSIASAPPVALPRRFLLTAPLWGVVAGLLVAAHAETVLLSRWAPATLAVVHAVTLGVLGNAMFGSLLQFLPAAAGVRVRAVRGLARPLHLLLNVGTAALVAWFLVPHPLLHAAAGIALPSAVLLLAAMTLPGLAIAHGQRLLRAAIATAVACAAVAAVLGLGRLLDAAGAPVGLARIPWTDVHASWGLLGWVLVLIAGVSQVVMPMFQGTPAARASHLAAWLIAVVAGLVVGSLCAAAGRPEGLRALLAGATAVAALSGLHRQRRARPHRHPWLMRAWRAGLLALTGAAVALAGGHTLAAGVLAIGIGLPLLVLGMQLEIVGFLGWIALQRGTPRGVRVPGIHALLPDGARRWTVLLHLSAAATLLLATAWPAAPPVALAGTAVAVAQAAFFIVLVGVGRRVDAVLAQAGATATG